MKKLIYLKIIIVIMIFPMCSHAQLPPIEFSEALTNKIEQSCNNLGKENEEKCIEAIKSYMTKCLQSIDTKNVVNSEENLSVIETLVGDCLSQAYESFGGK